MMMIENDNEATTTHVLLDKAPFIKKIKISGDAYARAFSSLFITINQTFTVWHTHTLFGVKRQ